MTVSAVGMNRLAIEKRREERIFMKRLVRLGRRTGIMRNISTSGVFFRPIWITPKGAKSFSPSSLTGRLRNS